MSEELDSNVNNLSVAEEAFEVYHSNSMCSGDECATLPERESREPAAGDGASELSDMSLENDIVSSTNIEDQSNLSYCNLDVGSEVNIAEDEPDEANAALDLGNEANADPSNSHETDYLEEQISAVTNDGDSEVNMAIEETVDIETVSSSETCQPTILSLSKQGRGRSRGRGRKRGRGRGRGRSARGKKTISQIDPSPVDLGTGPSSSMNLSSESVNDPTLEPANNETTPVQSDINGFASPTHSVDTSSQEVPVVRKRGRQKKEAPPVSDSESLRSTEEGSPKVPRKRGRPRKSLPPVNGDTLPATTSGSEMKDLNKMVENLTQLEDELREMQNNLSNLEKLDENMEEEDEEDICLSKLKTTIDSENNHPEPKDPILQGLQDMPSSPLAGAELANGISESTGAPVSEPIPEVKEIEKEKDNETTNKLDVKDENLVVEDVVENKPIDANESLLVEDVSKRPKRRNAKKTLKYKNDDDSDEDPFANVELSDDDEPRRGKKSGRYQSDDEYIPGRKGRTSSIDSSDSAAGDALEELKIKTKKRLRKKKDLDITDCEMMNLSPMKASNLNVVEDNKEPWRFSPTTVQDLCDDNDEQLPPPVSDETKATQPSNPWATSKEFENFLAKKTHGTNLKIKKLSSSKSTPSAVTPLEIPVLDANEIKKKVDCSSQTNILNTAATSTQTCGPGSLSMKTNVPLNNEQAENACKFLTSIVKTTSELGQLMTQKSDDFIKKKINTANVVDTFKMDYCVKKSFLLLKLAKHNLMQMEEDLSRQYEKFLQENELLSYREEEKKIEPKPKKADSDSDCEIVDETPPQKANVVVKKESKPKFNPKTVFLNKELSIKIAKKPTEEVKPNKNINIKGRHTVWISDSVMVKKVKGSQSFLAQDSRNKKPPDNKITEKMVSDFFAEYNRQEALFACAPFLSSEWFTWQTPRYVCNYFTVEPDKLTSDGISRTEEVFTDNENNPTVSDSGTGLSEKIICEVRKLRNPTTLLSICVKNLQEHFYLAEPSITVDKTPSKLEFTNKNRADVTYQPKSLFSSCFEHLTNNQKSLKTRNGLALNTSEIMSQNIPSLKRLCYLKISKLDFINKIESIDNTNQMESSDKIIIQDSINNNESVFYMSDSESDSFGGEAVKSLLTLCIEMTQHSQKALLSDRLSDFCIEHTFTFSSPNSLKHIAFQYVKTLLLECCSKSDTELPQKVIAHHTVPYKVKKLGDICFDIVSRFYEADDSHDTEVTAHHTVPYKVKKLGDICFDIVSRFYEADDSHVTEVTAHHTVPYKVKKLGDICFDIVSRFYVADDSHDTETADAAKQTMPTELTINAVNTLSEEAFLNIDDPSANDQDNSDYYEEDGGTFYEDESMEPAYIENEDANHTENESWISQVQLKELKSCATSDKTKPSLKSIPDNENGNITTDTMNTIMDNENSNIVADNYPLISNIKTEPGIEETPPVCENLAPMIKTEPDNFVDQMTIIPESVVTKRETFDSVDPLPVGREPIERQNSASFDEENFEAFVRSNKMIKAINNYENDNEETFSQSALRVRRQHEPDSDNENDTSMSLLVPHTFEALTVESAKGSLLQNSDSEGENAGKKNNKRRPVGRPKRKKPEPTKQAKEIPSKENKEVPSKENKEVQSKENKEVQSKEDKEVQSKENKEIQSKENKEVQSKDKSIAMTEVAILTRRMRERIRQEEKKGESSESDSEKASQNIQEKGAKKETRRSRLAAKNNKLVDTEIQCNNVDSTEHVDTTADKSKIDGGSNTKEDNQFTGFSAVDQNEISTYHKYVKYVYDQIIPKVNEETKPIPPEESSNKDDKGNENGERTNELINPDEPIELLECTPAMPMFEEEAVKSKRQPTSAAAKSPGKKKETKERGREKEKESSEQNFNAKEELIVEGSVKTDLFTERNGWKCYPINCSDTKLYEQVIIPLEKLPESFVQTYFEYQDMTVKSKDDAEIDRLTNLQSLNRLSNVNKSRTRKDKATGDDQEKSSEGDTERADSPVDNDNYNELSPSEDEGANYDDDYATQGPDDMENSIAKNSLMNDDDDDDTPLSNRKIKKEPDADVTYKKKRPGPKSKTVPIKQESPDSLMLTADKMMNKELTLLHAPVVLDNDNSKTPVKGPVTRNKPRSGTKSYGKGDRTKSDDSSSEEEKQWVSTKEKLLKRMGKKQETALEDDAKRAKLVSEFIERRSDGNKPAVLNHKVHKPRGRASRRSRKKMLERQKQMRVLSYELLGEAGPHIGKGNSAAYFKGRRNIRKVIDKKSLARSTVLANMEEFERKRRLNMKQKQLEELLGCEEGVNVIVTNDEVCLEYDFQVGQPAVTVHPFFTKVMKAHQYEGVKFMWDACFESLERVQSGHPGGGCILAHCMGLGKTLQVLALLHTVLTHPRVGMRRILVCCPLSTVLNWVDEIHKWIGPVTDEIKVFELSKLKKTYERAYQLEDWYNGGGIFIIGYELFRSLTTLDAELDDVRQTIIDKIRTALLDPGPDIIVCDEGHLLKNDCSVLAVAMSRVATRRRIVLTGTPMQNNLREYYCMVNFVKPNLLGTYSEYSNRFENPIMNGQHRDSQVEDIKLMKARTHILHKVLEGCLQRQEASVLYPYLPKKHEYTVFISLTKCQCDLYKHYLNVYANKNKQSILKDFHTLQKIWSHPQVLHNFNMKSRDEKNKLKAEKLEDDLAREDLTASEDIKPSNTEVWWLQYLEGGDMLEMLESSNKFITVFRILEESVALDDKVLIFSTSLITMDALEYFLKKINNWSLGQEYYRLDGSVPPEVRQKWCREFNAEHNYKTKLFLISTRAGSLGLNMTAANRVIILDTSWNPAHDIQSIFRVYRFGQKKDCFIYRLVALGTMEQKIYERAVTKQAVSCRVVDEQQIDRHYNMAELTELYRFDETGVGVAGGVAVGVQDVVLLRVARDAALHAVHEHDSLLRGSEPALPEHERAAAWQQFQQETQHNQPSDKVAKKEKKGAKRSLPADKPVPTPTVPDIKPDPDGDYTPPGEPKSKRGKKIINCRIPIQTTPQPSTSSQPDNFFVDKRQETDMVTQISQILVSHDFNSKKASRDLSKLIATVQHVVASGDLSQLPPGDEAAAKIAQILLRKQAAPPMPALTDVRPEIARPVQQATEDPDSNAETITGDLNVKIRRKAAVSAQQKFDSIAADIVVDLNDDDWRNGEDFSVAPTRHPEPEKLKYKPGPKSKKKPDKAPEPAPEPVQPIQQEEESILLSDDEILPDPQPTPVTIKQEPSAKKTEEKYPLHPSLLTNENFVKIVAHTYLAGNPMLDEDAATLAARYSTSKALKEIEATGKSIHSGPIYDIAVKVLGVEILKKLHNSDPATDAKATKQSEKAISDTEKMLSGATEKEPKRGRLKAKITSELMPKERKPMIANLGLVKLTPVTPVIAAPVVPVGLIKRATPVGTPSPAIDEECILPDDDDVHIVSAPASAPAPAPAPAPPPLVLSRGARVRNELAAAQGGLHTNIKVPIAPAPADQVPQTPVIKIVGNRGVITVGADKAPLAPPGPPPAASEAGTICLDSDDEDEAEAEAAPPVPVTLTAASSGVRLELRTPKETPLRTRPPAKQPPPTKPKGEKLLLDVDYYIEHVDSLGPPDNQASAAPKAPRPRPGLARLALKQESLQKPKSAVCKPGDILRITKTGEFEVLNKLDSVPPFASRVAKSVAGNSGNETPAAETKPAEQRPTPTPARKITSKAPEPAPTPVEQKTAPKLTEKPFRVSSGSSSSSRSASPEPDVDPLSILKDVVQIPADRYQSTSAAPKPASKPTPSAAAPSKPPTAAQLPKPNTLFKLEGKLALTQKLKALKAREQLKKTEEKFKKNVTVSKGASILVDSVDLTDTVAEPPQAKSDVNTGKSLLKSNKKIEPVATSSSAKPGKKIEPVAASSAKPSKKIEPVATSSAKPGKKIEPVATSSAKPGKKIEPVASSSAKPSKKIEGVATVVGTSKNIILTGSGKNKISVGPAPSTSSKGSLVRVTNMETLSPASFKRTDKKRPAIKQEPGAPKRKKTEPMTLKDFDIDDIDDIIELE